MTALRREGAGRVSLSFEVVEIVTRHSPHTTVVVHDTRLRNYVTDEILTIRGNPWPVGAKVDFQELLRRP
jgi:hypothetical protein